MFMSILFNTVHVIMFESFFMSNIVEFREKLTAMQRKELEAPETIRSTYCRPSGCRVGCAIVKSSTKPKRSNKALSAAGFMFLESKFLYDVPFDPNLSHLFQYCSHWPLPMQWPPFQ